MPTEFYLPGPSCRASATASWSMPAGPDLLRKSYWKSGLSDPAGLSILILESLSEVSNLPESVRSVILDDLSFKIDNSERPESQY